MLKAAKHQSAGFTLIELLVVLVVMSSVMMLIGPLSKGQTERSEALAEWYQVQRVIELTAKEAYLDGQVYSIELNGKSIKVKNPVADSQVEYSYKHVFFPPQTIDFNNHGYPTVPSINARVRSKLTDYRLQSNRQKTLINEL